MQKLQAILDEDNLLPFKTKQMSVDYCPGSWALYYRDPVACLKRLFGFEAFDGHIHVRPVKEVDENGHRVFRDFFSGEFVQEIYDGGHLKPGQILLLFVLYSDKTHLDVLGVHQSYPVYMYLGNVETEIRNKSGDSGIVLGETCIVLLFELFGHREIFV